MFGDYSTSAIDYISVQYANGTEKRFDKALVVGFMNEREMGKEKLLVEVMDIRPSEVIEILDDLSMDIKRAVVNNIMGDLLDKLK